MSGDTLLVLSANDEAALAVAADAAISQSLDPSGLPLGAAHGWLSGAPKDEPQAVAAVVSVGLPAMATSWRPILRPLGYQVQIIGVFCHQNPYVEFVHTNGRQECRELADLLIVVDDMVGTPDRRALLVQAKVLNAAPLTLSLPGDLAQFDLYSHWQPFNFRSATLKRQGNGFDLHSAASPGHAGQGYRYGGVDIKKPVGWEELAVTTPLVPQSGQTLGWALSKMIGGSNGREAKIGGTDDWSDCVDRLLTHTYHAYAGRSLGRPTRGVTALAFLAGLPTLVGLGVLSDAPPPGGGLPADEREEGPISTIHIRLLPWSVD